MTGRGHLCLLPFALPLAALCLAAAARTPESATPPRFFFSGDGALTLENAHNGERLHVRYRRADGSYDPAALAELRHFMRSRGDNREGAISLRLIAEIDYVEDLARPRRLLLDSGYRSPAYNDEIRARGARAASVSLHTQGLAADLQFIGVDIHRLWLRLRTIGCGGVGYYKEGNFLHIDVGPPRFWTAATSKVDQNLSAGNARVFARTDFDRYPQLDGAAIQLYSITAFPLRVSTTARVLGGPQPVTAKLAPDGDVKADGDCLLIDHGTRHVLRVSGHPEVARGRRLHLELTTCPPRSERTPERIDTNEIKLNQ